MLRTSPSNYSSSTNIAFSLKLIICYPRRYGSFTSKIGIPLKFFENFNGPVDLPPQKNNVRFLIKCVFILFIRTYVFIPLYGFGYICSLLCFYIFENLVSINVHQQLIFLLLLQERLQITSIAPVSFFHFLLTFWYSVK